MSLQHQLSHRTAYDRYPKAFATAARSVRSKLSPERWNVLSYGCSTGEEAHVLAVKYFPSSRVIGLDISDQVIRTARNERAHSRVVYDLSSEENMRRYGPFECITAMSVLCRWPDTENLEDIGNIYPFEMFSNCIELFDLNLRVGGVLVIVNANFNFLDTSVSENYEIVRGDLPPSNGFVHRFDRDNKRIVNYQENDCVYRKLR